MSRVHLVLRGLLFYWRTNLAVVLGVATAVAVLAGALLVGDSVRGSLRELVVERLGRTDLVVASSGFFREALGAEIEADGAFAGSFTGIAPMIAARAVVTGQESGRRAGTVAVYGVDDRFWSLHGIDVAEPRDREALVSPASDSTKNARPSRVGVSFRATSASVACARTSDSSAPAPAPAPSGPVETRSVFTRPAASSSC